MKASRSKYNRKLAFGDVGHEVKEAVDGRCKYQTKAVRMAIVVMHGENGLNEVEAGLGAGRQAVRPQLPILDGPLCPPHLAHLSAKDPFCHCGKLGSFSPSNDYRILHDGELVRHVHARLLHCSIMEVNVSQTRM